MVDKRRRLLLYENVRIHIDDVAGLGSFVELEGVAGADSDLSREHELVARLREELALGEPVAGSYSDLLLDAPQALLAAADAVMRNAYAPYSEFKVGAALRSPSGAIHVGANVENAAYPQGQCAEASAIGAMVAAGERAISAVAVVAEKLDVCPPCGGCRQRLKEFAAPDTPVYLGRPGGPVQTTTMAELLPLAFDEEALAMQRAGRCSSPPSCAAHGAPRVGIVLGSGLGAVAEAVEDAVSVGYDELPGFPRPTVHGHAGRAVLGRLRGVPVCVLMGRAHMYEGGDPAPRVTPVRALAAAGAEVLVLTNAAGSLRPEVGPGRLMAISDHINLTGPQPADRPQRRRHRPALPQPVRRLRPGAARGPARQRRASSTSTSPRASTSPSAGRASRPRPRSAPSAPWAPTRSACRPSTRRSSPATPVCAWLRSRPSPTSPKGCPTCR